MDQKKAVILPVATALASLIGPVATPASATTDHSSPPTDEKQASALKLAPNVVFTAGQDLLGLVVTQGTDGTVVAQHASHASHASHSSHVSSR